MDDGDTVLVVDDRVEARELVANELTEAGFRVLEAGDGVEGWACFRRDRPDLVVSDLRMPRADGIELLCHVRSVSGIPVVLLSARAGVPDVVAAMKRGAEEFLVFPDEIDRLVDLARTLLGDPRRSARLSRLDELVVGRNPLMRRVRERIAGLAPLRVPVLVSGESGAGRDCAVRAFHLLREGPGTPLETLPCGRSAPPKPPVGASSVYLDEVGRLPAEAQAVWDEWLSAAETRTPGRRPPRIYASTSEDLEERARRGTFHPGLARRLLRFAVELPPLRERIDDVGPLSAALIPRLGAPLGRPEARILPAAVARLKRHPWPGNVRELAETLERLIAFSSRGGITRSQVDQVLAASPESVASLRERRERAQREELVALLRECEGNLAEVARRLGVSRGAVIYRARKHGLLTPTKSG